MAMTTIAATIHVEIEVVTVGMVKGIACNSNTEVRNLPVKCVEKSATLLSIAGRGFRRTITALKNLLVQLLVIMVLTQIGTPILGCN
jgi:hypothetical protein